ncbi:MAG TPA: 50S ribosomal protein L17, partial [Spartobacteria bacterium]|nr:50S ribosomal protein L17 [Spartobacteria bacterium]
MRHQKKTLKLGRTAEHRKALLANQVCGLIEHERIKTTLAKAKAVRPLAEKIVTLGKNGSLHARRNALSILRQKDAVNKLFDEIAPRSTDRNGGYTRIVKLGQRKSDSASMAFIEWVDAAKATEEKAPKEKAPKQKKEPAAPPKESAPPP